jgi:hypothetical protein
MPDPEETDGLVTLFVSDEEFESYLTPAPVSQGKVDAETGEVG